MRYIIILIISLGWCSLSLYGVNCAENTANKKENTVLSEIDLIVELERTFKYISPTEVWVNVTVRKNGISGFARFVDSFSTGYTVGEVNALDGTVISEKGKLKVIWMKLPETDDLKISYKLKGKDLFLFGCMVEGRFSYLTDGQPIQIDLAPLFYFGREEGFDNGTGDYYSAIWKNSSFKENFESEAESLSGNKELINNLREKLEEADHLEKKDIEEIDGVVVMDIAEEEHEETNIVENNNYEEETIVEEREVEGVVGEQNEEESEDLANEFPEGEEIVSVALRYSIQITVVKYKLPENYFESKYGIKSPVFVETRGERFAYTVGSFAKFEEAKAFKEEKISPSLPGAFIIAYINDEIVSIQKALNFESK